MLGTVLNDLIYVIDYFFFLYGGYVMAQLVKALHYKPEDHGFDS